jgi:hypothetical protein
MCGEGGAKLYKKRSALFDSAELGLFWIVDLGSGYETFRIDFVFWNSMAMFCWQAQLQCC